MGYRCCGASTLKLAVQSPFKDRAAKTVFAVLPPQRHAMNAPLLIDAKLAAHDAAPRLREIPYNYTSFSDREIVIRLLDRKSTRLNSSHIQKSRMPSSA